MSKDVTGALVAIALLAPFAFAQLGVSLVRDFDGPFVRIAAIVMYLLAVGGFAYMGLRGGDTFHSEFGVYWVIGGLLIAMTFRPFVYSVTKNERKSSSTG
jgi:hypothetical protein